MTGDGSQKAKNRAWYFKEFKSEECLCGKNKKPRRSFCYYCYKALPPDMRKALYRSFGDGYEEAFDEAVKFLEVNVW